MRIPYLVILIISVILQFIIDILEIGYFDSDSNKFLVKSVKDYFEKYKNTPTMEAMKVLIDDVESGPLKTSIVDSLRGAWQHRESPDLEFIKEKSLEFCKNQVVKSAIMESVELLETQKYDEIKTIIDKVQHKPILGFRSHSQK